MMTGIFALVVVFLLSSLWLLSALLQKRKYGTKLGVKSTESTEQASKGTEIKAHDVGVLGESSSFLPPDPTILTFSAEADTHDLFLHDLQAP